MNSIRRKSPIPTVVVVFFDTPECFFVEEATTGSYAAMTWINVEKDASL